MCACEVCVCTCACVCFACVKERECVREGLCVRESKGGRREREREGGERTKGSKFNSWMRVTSVKGKSCSLL